MSKRNDRPKASEIFRESVFAFSRKVEFSDAFPDIEDVVVEVQEIGYMAKNKEKYTYRKNNFSEYVDCSNPPCYSGGVAVGAILREMVRNRETEIETITKCKGFEGSAKGKVKYRDCINAFKIKVSINYKNDFPSETT